MRFGTLGKIGQAVTIPGMHWDKRLMAAIFALFMSPTQKAIACSL
jgi:hypothetical protein